MKKYALPFMMLSLVMSSCWGPNRSAMPRMSALSADQLIDLHVDVDNVRDSAGIDHLVCMILIHNLSEQKLMIAAPTYLGIDIYPKMLNDKGDSLQVGIRVNHKFPIPTVEIPIHDSLVTRFPYDLERLFQMNPGAPYTFSMEYFGMVGLPDGSIARYDSNLVSNVVKIYGQARP